MADHIANLGTNTITEREIKGGRGPWMERTYPKGNTALPAGTVAAISAADGLVYAYDSADENLDEVKGVVLEDAAAEAASANLLVLGTINKDVLRVGVTAPDADALMALEGRHIYAVG